MRTVAVLFARADSVYKQLPGTDVFDIDRDARTWQGGAPVVAHPPCRAWGQLRRFAKPRKFERLLATWSVRQVRKFGGVLEHPAQSRLWPRARLPEPGAVDAYGGWTLPVTQHWWGHKAEKKTRLYIVGCAPGDIPPLPMVLGDATHVVTNSRSLRAGDRGFRAECTKAEREHTPRLFAEWLLELARRCAVDERAAA